MVDVSPTPPPIAVEVIAFPTAAPVASAASSAAAAAASAAAAAASAADAEALSESISVESGLPNGWHFVGSNGVSAGAILADGTMTFAQIVEMAARLTALESGSTVGLWDDIAMLADVVHSIGYGQSLDVGRGDATDPADTTPISYGYMHAGGVRPQDGGTNPATIYAALTTFAEAGITDGGTYFGETTARARLLYLEQLITLSTMGRKVFCTHTGEGSKTIAELSAGSIYHTRTKDGMTYAASLCAAAGLAYQPWHVMFKQGGAEYGLTPVTSRESWTASCMTLREDFEAHAQSITGNTRPLPMILYQISTHLNYGETTPEIALAQNNLLAEDQYTCYSTPSYFIPLGPDDLHPTTTGYRWLGAYEALAAKQWQVDGTKPEPLLPSQIYRSGKIIILKFPVATGNELVFDHTTVAAQTDEGLRVVTSAGASVAITVALLSTDSIKITCATDPGDGYMVRYAWENDDGTALVSAGNIRDNRGDSAPYIFDPLGENLPLHRWVPIFEQGETA